MCSTDCSLFGDCIGIIHTMITYKTLPYTLENLQSLKSLWEDNWQLCTIYDGKMFLSREEKKPVKSRALTTESNKWIVYLRKQREQIDSNLPIHIPDFVSEIEEWNRFVNHWTQKNSEDSKMHCEKQKTFDIRARWNNWNKDKPKSQTKFNTIW